MRLLLLLLRLRLLLLLLLLRLRLRLWLRRLLGMSHCRLHLRGGMVLRVLWVLLLMRVLLLRALRLLRWVGSIVHSLLAPSHVGLLRSIGRLSVPGSVVSEYVLGRR